MCLFPVTAASIILRCINELRPRVTYAIDRGHEGVTRQVSYAHFHSHRINLTHTQSEAMQIGDGVDFQHKHKYLF